MSEPATRTWTARWITAGTLAADAPAPYLRKTFTLEAKPAEATLFLCSAGWHEVYVNGEKIDDRVLAPVATQFDRRISYIAYDAAPLLRAGKNAIVVLLGNGWYNCFTENVWLFQHASWRSSPKMLCELVVDGRVALRSDDTWKTRPSPIVFNALRNGEHYDARLETPGFADPDASERGWKRVARTPSPGGLVVEEEAAPCRAGERCKPVKHIVLPDGATVFDFGRNLAGWCEIDVAGEAGARITLDHAEKVLPNGDIDPSNIDLFVKSGKFQHDEYVLAGCKEGESWHPRFTYHGFQYVRVRIEGAAELRAIRARFVHSGFPSAGSFSSSCAVLDKLQEITLRSYLSNFTGFPTDCPHREKNGWTGDAALACETGLWNFHAAPGYLHYAQMLVDTQRPDGSLCCIAPTAGWGYEWGNGPTWDSLLFEVAYQLYRFEGDDTAIRRFYPAMLLYLRYLDNIAWRGIVDFGLGDWCPADESRAAPGPLLNTGYYYLDTLRTAAFARLLGEDAESARLARNAGKIRDAFNRTYHKGDGHYAKDEWTSLGAALFFGLAESEWAPKTAKLLAEAVRANAHKADFGILGAKYVPRVLAAYGYADDAFRLVTQTDYPGWGHWVARGATTLHEQWNDSASLNHIMFGDPSAWAYEFLGGIHPSFEHPGFAHVLLQPIFPSDLDHFKAKHDTPHGTIRVSWKRGANGTIVYTANLPKGVTADVRLPGTRQEGVSGKLSFEV
ncbi:MAG: family 78 glycoside hydrolase catalytic domain [Kiritimatiellia bacterium]